MSRRAPVNKVLDLMHKLKASGKHCSEMVVDKVVLLFVKPGAKPRFHGKLKHDVYVKAGPEAESTGHPAQKPLDFVAHIVEHITPPDGLTLDPYSGSGSTGVAAIMSARRFIGIERESEYVGLSRARLAEAQRQIAIPLPA